MKITKIKRMNEKELLHHIIDNTEICDIKYANDGGGNTDINLDLKNIGGNLKFNYIRGTGLSDALYDVEVEEEITEDTVFNYFLLTYKKDNDKIETHRYEDNCIKSVLSQSSRLMYVSEQLSITYFDDKGIPHLIWTHEKGLVE